MCLHAFIVLLNLLPRALVVTVVLTQSLCRDTGVNVVISSCPALHQTLVSVSMVLLLHYCQQMTCSRHFGSVQRRTQGFSVCRVRPTIIGNGPLRCSLMVRASYCMVLLQSARNVSTMPEHRMDVTAVLRSWHRGCRHLPGVRFKDS